MKISLSNPGPGSYEIPGSIKVQVSLSKYK